MAEHTTTAPKPLTDAQVAVLSTLAAWYARNPEAAPLSRHIGAGTAGRVLVARGLATDESRGSVKAYRITQAGLDYLAA